jgi:hypothetical protein
MWREDDDMKTAIEGRTVSEVWASYEYVTFVTDQGPVTFTVYGDCCSHSYFHDVIGADNLLAGGVVTELSEVELSPGDPGYHPDDCPGRRYDYETGEYTDSPCGVDHDSLVVYGYRIVSDHPEWGEVTTVLSFRNDSNGYYGGWMQPTEGGVRSGQQPVRDNWTVDYATV